MDRYPMHPPLRQKVQFRADCETPTKLGDCAVKKRTLAAIKCEKEHRKGAKKGVCQRQIQAFEEEVLAITVLRIGGRLGEALLKERRDGCVRASAVETEGVDSCPQLGDVTSHQQRECLLDGGKILLGCNDREE